ncbi:hypothetical protein [Okeania hirsuta]|uniref:hypothetical protein n=1 Tax=Okeania hirsuta TaxID=1458930 RepID=UPI00195FA8EC|nr:hypothetical protein [Okeania hirsuta]
MQIPGKQYAWPNEIGSGKNINFKEIFTGFSALLSKLQITLGPLLQYQDTEFMLK